MILRHDTVSVIVVVVVAVVVLVVVVVIVLWRSKCGLPTANV